MADWLLIASAPFDTAIEVAIIDRDGFRPVEFPVRRTEAGWVDANSNARLDIDPTHWRKRQAQDEGGAMPEGPSVRAPAFA
jgi:hypothetical protein